MHYTRPFLSAVYRHRCVTSLSSLVTRILIPDACLYFQLYMSTTSQDHDGRVFVCDRCPKRYARRDYLERHILNRELPLPQDLQSDQLRYHTQHHMPGMPSCIRTTRCTPQAPRDRMQIRPW